MKVHSVLPCVLLAASILATDLYAQDQASSGTSVKVPANKIEFVHTGVVREGKEILLGPAYGDYKTGKHGSFVRFPGGYVSKLHFHTSDYYAVIVEGTLSNPLRNEKDAPLPPGSYYYQKGGEAHYTKCISKEDCLIFIISDGKWDTKVTD